jgi:hypothetical protein
MPCGPKLAAGAKEPDQYRFFWSGSDKGLLFLIDVYNLKD